jgi:LCP family protein required for cell wall assembly
MNCREACRLLDQGVIPGSSSPERAALGFHLAGCPRCRAYRATLQDRLLIELLAQAPGTNVPPRPAKTPASPAWYRRALLSQLLWYLGLGVLATIALVAAVSVGSLILSIFHIHRNVQAMIVPPPQAVAGGPATLPTAAPTPTPVPTVVPPTPTRPLPSATPRPTATPVPSATPTPTPPPPGDPVTLLLLGSDRRPGESEPARTDAIIVAHIDPQRHRVALLSLPRDLWVEIPGYGQARINAANVWGQIYGEPGGGLALARATVSHLLGIPIDYTVYIDFEGFIGAIDALGGVTVNVEKELYDPHFPTMDYRYTVAHFLPGPQHMDGATALMYSRVRHPDSDFARMRRQQAVLVAILGRLHEQNALASIKRIEEVTTALRDYVRTDIPEERLIGLAWALRDVMPDQIERYVLDEQMVSFGVGADAYAEIARPGAIETLMARLLGLPYHSE